MKLIKSKPRSPGRLHPRWTFLIAQGRGRIECGYGLGISNPEADLFISKVRQFKTRVNEFIHQEQGPPTPIAALLCTISVYLRKKHLLDSRKSWTMILTTMGRKCRGLARQVILSWRRKAVFCEHFVSPNLHNQRDVLSALLHAYTWFTQTSGRILGCLFQKKTKEEMLEVGQWPLHDATPPHA